MKYGIYIPTFHDFADPAKQIELAGAAEAAGWDGYFVWDHLVLEPDGNLPICDATVVLSAIAATTERLSIGPMITPLARRRPWKVAKEVSTLDHLSDGRVIFGVGLGEPPELEFEAFGEDGSAKTRAEKLNEGLEILGALLEAGKPYSHQGSHYRVENALLAPPPRQRPRPPIWAAAVWPALPGVKRAARCEGVFPIRFPDAPPPGGFTMAEIDWSQWWLSPEDLRAVGETISDLRGGLDGFDLVATGRARSSSGSPAQLVESYREIGATWWLEWIDGRPESFGEVRALIDAGPPR